MKDYFEQDNPDFDHLDSAPNTAVGWASPAYPVCEPRCTSLTKQDIEWSEDLFANRMVAILKQLDVWRRYPTRVPNQSTDLSQRIRPQVSLMICAGELSSSINEEDSLHSLVKLLYGPDLCHSLDEEYKKLDRLARALHREINVTWEEVPHAPWFDYEADLIFQRLLACAAHYSKTKHLPDMTGSETSDDYKPWSWFKAHTDIENATLNAASKRDTKRVRSVGTGSDLMYNVDDARRIWPNSFE